MESENGIRSVELDNAFYIDDGKWIESLTVSAEGFDAGIVETISGIRTFDVQELPTGPSDISVFRLTVIAREPYPFILGVVLRQEAIPNRIVLSRGQFDVTVTVRDWETLRSMADEIDDRFGRFDLNGVTEIDRAGEPLDSGRLSEVLISKLSDDQLVVLETAYEIGYFEVPREATAGDVAEALGIAQSTVSERLRVAQRNLFELIYGSRDGSGPSDEVAPSG